ncbi:phosphoenolpyruvate hydrolase family protein [Actinotignum urinale]|uniref:phosphoenolpyruvate hydrolase family protein n=1 Tax=Actinotignum urinale TaxID=190146 RepID=UPI0003FD7A50|nr:phosphoenolpyruvate hydrolase family protein [Actinotignum urinale]MDY5160088.1 phosphoenolpyruvate hydrolase family protein [Actinotignum urinale]
MISIAQRLQNKMESRQAIVIAGVGSGISAKAACEGGADIIVTYNTAAYRILGLPTALAFLPYDNCNDLSFKLAPQVKAAATGGTPVLIGLGAHDPRDPVEKLLDKVESLGLHGVANEPFIGMYSQDLRGHLEQAGLGFNKELELIAGASKRGMYTLGYAFNPSEALQLIDCGCDVIGAMVGGVTAGSSAGGSPNLSLDDAIRVLDEIVVSVKRQNSSVPVLAHGGPLADVTTVQKALRETGADGYITGSTGERVPINTAVSQKIAEFANIKY